MRAHIFHHTPLETAGSIAPWLAAHEADVSETRFYEQATFPSLDGLDLIVVMGGALSANDEAGAPWLTREKAFLRDAIAREVPTLGICLGSQIIASALGARVRPNAYAEYGWSTVDGLAHETSAFRFPAQFRVFQAHGDTFDLPSGATHLATNAACTNQAFQFGASTIALQFHLESTRDSALALVEECATEFSPGPYVQGAAELRAVHASAYAESVALMGRVLEYLSESGLRGTGNGLRDGLASV